MTSSEAPPRLSLCMIVRNEAHFLGRCLDAVRGHVDEMIVVDTGSTDATRDIAVERGARLFEFEWIDDFAAARNYSLAQATGDWILVLDADELVAPEDMAQLRVTISDTIYDAFFLTQRNYSNDPLEKDWVPVFEQTPYTGDYAGYCPNPIGRLFRNRLGIHYQGRVHEVIDLSLSGLNSTSLDIPLHHHVDSDPNKPKATRQLNYLRIIEDALAERPDGRLCASAASVYMYFRHDFRTAMAYYQQAADLGHEVQENLERVAEAHYRLGETREALERYSALHEGGYRSFSLCNNLANLCVRAGELERAITLLREALDSGVLHGENADRLRHNIRHLEQRLQGDKRS